MKGVKHLLGVNFEQLMEFKSDLVQTSIVFLGKRERHIVVTCLDCRTVRRYLCRPDHVLWSEQKFNNAQEDKKDKNTLQENQKQEQGKSL